jgi:hypothetical protein
MTTEYFVRNVELESVGPSNGKDGGDAGVEEEEEVRGVNLAINQQWEGDVGVVVWDAALLLLKFMDHQNSLKPGFLRNSVALELGAGTGVCGLAAAALGCEVVLTDLPHLVKLLDRNIVDNLALIQSVGGGKVMAKAWKWASFGPNDRQLLGINLSDIDYILASDLIYYEEGLNDLIQSLEWFCSFGKQSLKIYMSYEHREGKLELLKHIYRAITSSSVMTCKEVEPKECHPHFQSPDLHLLLIQPKPKPSSSITS